MEKIIMYNQILQISHYYDSWLTQSIIRADCAGICVSLLNGCINFTVTNTKTLTIMEYI